MWNKYLERAFLLYHVVIGSFLFQTNLPVFKVKDSTVRRRYSDFEWLRTELERDSKVSSVLCNYYVYTSLHYGKFSLNGIPLNLVSM